MTMTDCTGNTLIDDPCSASSGLPVGTDSGIAASCNAITLDNVINGSEPFYYNRVGNKVRSLSSAGLLSGIRTPMDYGAVGDGVTDDTEVLQTWADGEDTYYLGDNDYYFTDTLSFNDKADSVWTPSKGKLIAEVYNKTVIEFINCPNIDVNGLNIDMSMIDTASQSVGFKNGVLFSLCPYGKLRNSFIYGAPSQAVNVRDLCTGFKVDNNYIIESGRLQQINEGTGISIGGAILCFVSSRTQIINNYIERSWSAAIVCYTDTEEGGNAISYEPVEGALIDGNYIYESQSNGIRVQPDNYPAADLVYDINITNNIVLNTGRTCIRGNGFRINISGNVAGFDLKQIYGSTSDLPNNAIASNHCKHSSINNNIVFNTSAGIELTPNSIADYGCEDTDIKDNIIINCVYGIYRGGDLTKTVSGTIEGNSIYHGEYINIEGGDSYPAREPINLRNCDDLYITNNKISGRSKEFDFSASITLLDCGDVYISDNKTEGASSSISANNCNLIISESNIFDNVYSGVAAVDCREFYSSGNRVSFNSIQTTNTVGYGLNNVSYISIKDNVITGDEAETTSAILLVNSANADLTTGVISSNEFNTTNGVNNQIVGGVADGASLAQYNNYFVRTREFDNVKAKRVQYNGTTSLASSTSDCNKLIVFSHTITKSINLPSGAPIGWSLSAINMAGKLVINSPGGESFLTSQQKGFPRGVTAEVTKVDPTRWAYQCSVSANEDSISGTFKDGDLNVITVENGLITDLGL